jgi:dipeptidyl aminopeptidase/acylaminoacyl peptidase
VSPGLAGSWPSPITPELVVSASVRLGQVRVAEGPGGREEIWWDEQRPDEGGRTVVVRRAADGTVSDASPSDVSAASRAHEYGGAGWWLHGDTLFYVDAEDQRIWRMDAGFESVPLTPEPRQARGLRYADGIVTPDGRWIVCVAEVHPGEDLHPSGPDGADGAEPCDLLVAVPSTGGAPVCLFSEADFVSSPRLDPETGLLAWVAWSHPDMPWDATELWVAALQTEEGPPVLGAPRVAFGGPGESVLDPLWDATGHLWFVSDRTGWWNLYRCSAAGRPTDDVEAVDPRSAEAALPHWVFGQRRYDLLSDGRAVVAVSAGGTDHLVVVDPFTGGVDPLAVDVTAVGSLAATATTLVWVGATFSDEPSVRAALVGRRGSVGPVTVLRPPRDLGISTAYLSQGRAITFPTASTDGGGDSAVAHGIFYAPANPEGQLGEGERPPVVVMIHGGPTSSARSELRLAVQFWTSRGFAVVDVNHRGSSGFGRPYRDLLRGGWGVVDVEDCAAAVRWLAEEGHIDPDRAVIRGGSAGGFTTLMALATTDVFAAGASYYGIGDLSTLATTTHGFESRYFDSLIGPWPEATARYRERSPITIADRISAPVIVFQGSEDRVVPPQQAEQIIEALRANGVPHAYRLIEGEGHGFRRTETVADTLRMEWSFYSQVLGFPHPAGVDPTPIWRPS